MRSYVVIAIIAGLTGFVIAPGEPVSAQSWEPMRPAVDEQIRIEEYGSYSHRAEPAVYESTLRSRGGFERLASGAVAGPVQADLGYSGGAGLAPTPLDPNCAYPTPVAPPIIYQPVAPVIAPVMVAEPSIWAGPGFYASGDALALQPYTSDFVISSFRQQSATPAQPALTADNFDWDIRIGPRVTVGYMFASGNAVEGTYFGLYNWNETAVVTDPTQNIDLLALPGSGGSYDDFSQALQEEASWTTRLDSAELNYRVQFNEWASGIVGFRWLRIEEDFNLRSIDDANAATNIGLYNIGTDNNLIGLQVGGDADLVNLNRLTLIVGGSAGFFANLQQNSFQVVDDNILRLNGKIRETELASLVEAGVKVRYRVLLNMHAHVGYDVLMVNGVALAAQQVPNAIISNSIFYHGPAAGVTWRR